MLVVNIFPVSYESSYFNVVAHDDCSVCTGPPSTQPWPLLVLPLTSTSLHLKHASGLVE